MLKIVEEIWNHHLDENDRLEFDISSLHLSLKYLQNFLYRGIIIILCLRHLLWNQHQTMIVACHLYSVRIRYQYVYHLHYCSKDCHHYNSCCHWCYFRGDCFCCCYCHWDSVWQPKACNFLKKRLWHRCFPVNFAKFQRTLFWQNTSGRLLLKKGMLRLHNTRKEILSFGTTCIDWRQYNHNWKAFCC